MIKKILNSLKIIGHFMGLFWTKLILGIFYVSIFAIAAIFIKKFNDPLQKNQIKSTWRTWNTAGKDWFYPF